MYTAGSPRDCSLEQKSINFLIGIDVVSLINKSFWQETKQQILFIWL